MKRNKNKKNNKKSSSNVKCVTKKSVKVATKSSNSGIGNTKINKLGKGGDKSVKISKKENTLSKGDKGNKIKQAKSKKRLMKRGLIKKKTVWFWIVAVWAIGMVVLSGILVGYLYTAPSLSNLSKVVYAKMPFPIVRICNNEIIAIDGLLKDVVAVRKFYETKMDNSDVGRVDFSTNQGKVRLRIKEKDVLNKLIEDKIILKIATDRNINVTDNDVDKAVKETLQKSDSTYEALAVNLRSNYGWTVSDFKNKIVKNQLYLQRLFEWYEDDIKNRDGYKNLEAIKSKLLEDNSNFSELANKFSEGESSVTGGEINWILSDDIIPELAVVIKGMAVGTTSDVVISALGMHVVFLEDRRERAAGEGRLGGVEVQIKQIFIEKDNFINWIQYQKKQSTIDIFLREYQWDSSVGEVIFRDAGLRALEDSVRSSSQGDPSLY